MAVKKKVIEGALRLEAFKMISLRATSANTYTHSDVLHLPSI